MNEREFELYRQKTEIMTAALTGMGQLCEDMNLKDQSEKMKELSDQLLAHRFAVGVMGEFRRGKSTVINSLLGENVMPSDIRPCSATMNRVTYGEEKKAVISMKDGKQEKISIEELPRYVTKLEEYEDMAANVDEATVYYPSRFCKDGVDIIDTPGLNDDERMDKVSREVVPKLDGLIMTIVPDSPFSISEARFVRDTLLTNDLSRMIFLINKIDMVDEEDRDTLLAEIRKRIQEKTLDEMKNLMGEQSEVYQNAKKVLNNISIYPISARDSLKGKLRGKPALVEESGAAAFENALTEMLTGERAALELGHACSILCNTAVQIQSELNSRHAALDMSAREFEEKQSALEEAKRKTIDEADQKIKELDSNAEELKTRLRKKAEDYYSEMEVYLKNIIDSRASEWDRKRMSDPQYQAMVTGQIQEKIKDEIGEQMKAFTVRTIGEMEQYIGKDAENISEFTSEVAKKMNGIIHTDAPGKIMDNGDIAATAIDVITDFAGIYGVGGIIAGARAAGVKGAVVGGGIGLVSTLAIAAACPIAGIPMLIISCAGGTLASKFATKKIFAKDIGEKKIRELTASLKKSVEDTVKQISEEKQLEEWVENQVVAAYNNLRIAMKDECQRCIEEATTSLKEMDNIRKTALEEHKAKKEEFALQEKKCEEILSGIKPVTEWLSEQNSKAIA